MKILTFVLISIGLCVSCELVGSSQTQPVVSVENSAKKTNQETFDTQQDEILSNSDVENNENDALKVISRRPFQSKARRKKIEFPDGCQHIAGVDDEYLLEKTCADALYNVQPDLPKTHIIGAVSPKSNPDTPKIDCDYVVKQNSNGHFDLDEYEARFYPLSPNKYLVKLICSAGAYNEINAYLLYDESALPAKAEVLEFPSIAFTHGKESERPKTFEKTTVKTVGGIDFNPKTKKLTVLAKGRGVGDFGQYARYSFPNGKPKLEEYRADFKEGCPCYQRDEVVKHPPKKWKRYYP